ncbi:GNAT family N-acetyltransferase [Sphingomonas lutea]|uniref:GNAT family N-acetyltransferase n=1 Tax=Sphingomonas lutea TaxID=1045317 RepID=A0A7G9SHV9_9SPHN|nr:GNAT family N-acetyltransferase [Sphingomonas lutea]QNN67434.1 GNAT family N-acetyltransferase [Sphingomonas lutea]
MNVTYRDAVDCDAAALKDLFAETFVETFGHLYRPADLQAFLDGNTLARWQENLANPDVSICVAESDHQLVGFIELAPKGLPHDTDVPALELRRLYLRSSARGLGIADALMRWILDKASSRGAQELVLSVFIDNHRARRFYERYGFDIVGKYDFMVGSHADEDLILRHVIMQGHA